jgi:hypothetical protein
MDHGELLTSFSAIKMLSRRLEAFSISTREGWPSCLDLSIRVLSLSSLSNIFVCFTCSFNWGLRVRSLSERVLKLLESEPFLKEERGRARKLTHGIQGFGSFGLWSSSTEATLKNSCFEIYGRCNPHYNENSSIREGTRRARQTHQDLHSVPKEPENDSGSGQGLGDGYAGEDHPFCNNANRTVASLISTNE